MDTLQREVNTEAERDLEQEVGQEILTISITDRHWHRDELYRRTLAELRKSVELADLNDLGVYHKVHEFPHFEQMVRDWIELQQVPDFWISKGRWPGIWSALFEPEYTFSLATLPAHIVRFRFNPGYYLFDGQNEEHQEMFDNWSGRGKRNSWTKAYNSRNESLADRLKSGGQLPLPHHKRFYSDNKFGAAIGYSDYVSPVILLEDSVNRVEFMRLDSTK